MKVPDETHRKIESKLWSAADSLSWPTMSDLQKSALYEEWIQDAEVGEVLSRYIRPGNVRVYIKDTIMKPYGRERIKEFPPILKLLNLPEDTKTVKNYIKPHGRRLADGKVICWGLSRDWKAILFAVFERAFVIRKAVPYSAVIMFPTGKCQQPEYRRMIDTAATKMGIEKLVWHDA